MELNRWERKKRVFNAPFKDGKQSQGGMKLIPKCTKGISGKVGNLT